MIVINLSNVEDIIFYNTEIKNKLPKYKNFFDSWELSQRVSGLRQLKTTTLLDFLNSISSDEIEEVLQTQVIIESINTKIVENSEYCLDDIELNWYGEFCLYRNSDKVYITCWR